ncbi:MAG: hypothetical protein RIT27_1688 [Pseudomonadota bacterium]|jgi:adhesin/invasin
MIRGFLTIFFATLLAGCGGGGAFTATTGTGTTTTPGTGTTNGNATLTMSGKIVIPQGQKSTTLTFTFRNENGTPITDGTLTFTVSGSARVGGKSSGSTNTDSNGDARVTIEDTVSEAVTLSVTPTAPNRTFTPTHLDYPLYFSPVINAFISNNGQPANGTAAAKLTVRIQGQAGNPFVDVPTALAFSPKSFAVAVSVPAVTDSNGIFTVDITDTVAETLLVYPNLGGYVLEGLPVTFTASTLTLPASVNLTVSGSPVLADGAATADLTVIARDISGTPIADADVVLSSSSGSAVLGAARGKTGSNGVFKTTISNSVVENVQITPMVANVLGVSKTVAFVKNASTTTPVATVEVSLNGDPRPASGSDAAILTIFARNASGEPVVGADVSLRVSGGSAVFSPDSGKTDNLGRFVINITDKVAETFTVTPVVSTVVGATKTLTFNAIPSSSTAVPASVAVTAANNNQAADGQASITLNVVVRDANNIPLSGVDVTLASESTTALLTAASGKTNAGGVFTTTVKDTKAETFKIKANAGAVSSETNVTFGAQPNATISQVTITDNNKLANGTETITVTTLVRDAQNQPAVGIPMIVAINPNTAGAAASAIPDKATGITGAGGEFVIKLTDTVAETFTVSVSVNGAPNTIKRSGNITFIEAASTVQPTSLELLTSSPQLASEGKADGVVLTAILKTKDNNPYKGGEVRFSSDSGTIQPIAMGTTPAGTTNDAGQAQARLTTEGNPINRDIKVIAKSGELTQEITITVDGTVLSITGQGTAIQGSSQELVILLKDSAGKGVSGKKLKVVSSLNNPLSNSNPTTDGSGSAKVVLTAKNAGKDTITVSFDGIATDKIESVNHILTISNDNFTVTSSDNSPTEDDVPLGTTKQFKIHWDKSGAPQLNEIINISASRGRLGSNSVMTNTSGDATFTISSSNAGPTEITVAAKTKDGPSKVIKFDFVATQAVSLDLQAEPATLGVNIGSNTSEQSTIIAVVRDANNNLVKGKRIEFNVTDVTAGEISPSFAITDVFGRATTVYRSGSSTGANKDVTIEGKVVGTSIVKTVKITVARRQAFIILGTGDKFIEYDLTKYKLPYTALVTDVNGNPVKGATVDFTVIPTDYTKGWWKFDKAETKWVQYIIVGCANEDINKNSILDVGEDINNNGHLDPRNIATLADASGVGSGNAIKITTNENGFADLNVLYPKNYAYWTDVQLIARTVVGGTESQASTRFQLKGTATDFAGDGSIPGETSPFGIGVNAGSKALGGYWIDETNIGDINGNGSIDTKLPATCQFAPELNPEKVDSNLAVFK